MIRRLHRRELRQEMRKNALLFLVLLSSLFLFGCTERRQMRFMEQAEEELSRGHATEASELLRKSVALNPESKTAVRAIYKLGFTLESYLKDYEGALFNYQEFIRLSQDRVSIYEVQKRIANLYYEQLHDPDKAISAYKKILTFSPDSLEADNFQYKIAQSFYQQNNFEQARLEYQTLLEKYPKSQLNARARYEIGNTYYMEGKYDIGLEALKQVLRHNPQSEWATEAQFLMAESLDRQEKLQAALQTYENIQGRYSSAEILNSRIAEIKKRMKAAPK